MNILLLKFIAKKEDKYGEFGLYFILPFYVFLIVFYIYPIIYSLRLSFTRWDGFSEPIFIGFENFERLFLSSQFYKCLYNTFSIWIVCIFPQMIVGLSLALILTSCKIKGIGIFRAIFYLPNLVTMTSIGLLSWFILDEKYGILNIILIKLGIISVEINWLGEVWLLKGSISLILFWMWFGYSMIIFIVGIKSIPEELYEVARVDGASSIQMFLGITLPMLRYVIAFQLITSLIGGIAMFDVPFVLAGNNGGVESSAMTIIMYLYRIGFITSGNGYGYAATIGTVLFLFNLVLVMIIMKVFYRNI